MEAQFRQNLASVKAEVVHYPTAFRRCGVVGSQARKGCQGEYQAPYYPHKNPDALHVALLRY
jgi:hypothetical protein